MTYMNKSEHTDRPDATCYPLGDAAVTIEFANRIDPDTHRRVQALARYLERNRFPGMIEYVPSFSSITVFYNPVEVRRMLPAEEKSGEMLSFDLVSGWLRQAVATMKDTDTQPPRIVEIPVCYGGEFGPDLPEVAKYLGLSVDEVVDIHSSADYTVYMIGFAPGFPYLGGMPERIATPRRPSPRLSIPAGTIGIGGQQTGIYPIETPGGWQLIGRTPVRLFRPDRNPPSLLMAGDIVRFRPISRKEYTAYEEGER